MFARHLHHLMHSLKAFRFRGAPHFVRSLSSACCPLVGVMLAFLLPIVAHAQSSVTITQFFGFPTTGNYADGHLPETPLLQASDGNFYGTTLAGGNDGSNCAVHICYGTVFKLTLQGQFTLLHTFAYDVASASYADGRSPHGGVVEGPDGYLYGTTYEGGAAAGGTVFKISKTGQFQKLHDFCVTAGCPDGENAEGNLVVGVDGNLYGTTSFPGPGGVIFRISPAGAFTTLVRLAVNSAAGVRPSKGLVLASDGNFYGETLSAVYRVTPGGTLTALHTFGPSPDGSSGYGPLIQAADGNLYGVTSNGGTGVSGTVFRISMAGDYLKIFDLDRTAEGLSPVGLVQATDGNLWGTTAAGPGAGLGTVYTITTAGTPVQATLMTRQTGLGPHAPLIQASDGKLYGTASSLGVPPADGTVFVVDAGLALPPPPPPPPMSQNGKETGDKLGKAVPPETTCSPGAGDPIDIASGNMFYAVADCVTAGQNPLRFTRFYNSRASTDTFAASLGSNWRSTFDRYLKLASASSVIAERADGKVLNFTLQGSTWPPDSDVDLKLTQTGSTWSVTNPEDTVETYASISGTEAILTSIKARNGYTQTLLYNSGNQLQSVTDSFNRSLNFTYQNGLLHTLTTPDNLVLTFSYDSPVSGANRLVSVTYSTSPQTSQAYVYENSGLPFALTGVIGEDGNRYATWTYDAFARGLTTQHGSGADLMTLSYNDSDGSRTVTNALGVTDTYSFTTLQGVPKVTQISRAATSTTAAATQSVTYDANGWVARRTDWKGNQTVYVNDTRGEPTSITEAAGTPQARTTAITYDATFHLPVKIVQPGVTTDLVYDASGNLLTRTLTDTTATTLPYATAGTKRTWTFTWANSLLASAKGPRTDVSQLTSFTYDSSGTLIKITNALGQIMQVTQHTQGGLPQTVIDPNNVTTQLAYDARLRLTSRTMNTAAGALITRYAYDAVGNLLSVTLPDGSQLANTYDAAHRLTGVTDLFNQKTVYTLDALGDRTQLNVKNAANVVKESHSGGFDALGRILSDTGGAGQVTTIAYDENGNALTVADPLGRLTQRVFDPLNRLFKVTDPAGGIATTIFDAHDRPLSVTAQNGAVTSYVYDGFGDLIQTASPDTGKTIYRYDPAGNLTQKVDATNATANYTYDALDRVLTTSYPSDPAENVAYIYDQPGHGFGIGRVTSVTDAAGSLTRTYDERGNVIAERRVQGSVTLSTSYAYDRASRIASIIYPSGATAAYARDIMGRITGVTMKPKNGSPLPVASRIGYQPFGPVSGFSFGNGIAESRGFDLDYRLTSLSDTGTGAVQNLAYGYNAADDVLSIADTVHATHSQSFAYDALDRLTAAAGLYGSLAYTYDSAGNRLTQHAGSTATTSAYAPQSNRLVSVSALGITETLGYTGAGNIDSFKAGLTGRPGITTRTLTYNQNGRLAAANFLGLNVAQYAYDAFGHRIVKTGALTGKNFFQYDQAGHLLEQTDRSGSAQADYIYLGDRPIATYQPSDRKMYFLHDDRLGTPQVATDSTQAVAWTANYEPFGTTTTGAAGIVQNLRLPGQEFEIETGWNHNGFRDYVPALGRYLESDPIGLTAGWNTYGYVKQNPVQWIDPTGLNSSQQCFAAPVYNPSFWNDGSYIQSHNNCYSYAKNQPNTSSDQSSYKPQPGAMSGAQTINAANLSCSSVISAACSEGMTTKTDNYGNCPSGYHAVELFIAPNQDYHWYAQNADGTWSSKPGNGPVTNTDASGLPISDPYTANRNYPAEGKYAPVNYSVPCGSLCAPNTDFGGLSLAPTQ